MKVVFLIFLTVCSFALGSRLSFGGSSQEELNECNREQRKKLEIFIAEKTRGFDECKTANDCIFLTVGGGYHLNKGKARSVLNCLALGEQKYRNYCSSLLNNHYKELKEGYFPRPHYPSGYSCQMNVCAPRYGGKNPDWIALRQDLRKGAPTDKACESEISGLFILPTKL